MNCADPPGKPGRPEVVDYDKDRAEIKWEPPKNDGGSPLTKYVIEKKMKGGSWEKVRVINFQFVVVAVVVENCLSLS